MSERGNLFVISGPSGAGKGTVIAGLRKRMPDIYLSVSATTRPPRRGERPDVDYHFLDKAEFQEMIRRQELLEWAEYVGNYYGTPAKPVDERLEMGYDVILEIEMNGANQVMKLRPDAVGIFLFPGSFRVLEERLRLRNTDPEDKLLRRLEKARLECAQPNLTELFDYIIINDRVETAVEEAVSIITAEKCRSARRLHYLKEE